MWETQCMHFVIIGRCNLPYICIYIHVHTVTVAECPTCNCESPPEATCDDSSVNVMFIVLFVIAVVFNIVLIIVIIYLVVRLKKSSYSPNM